MYDSDKAKQLQKQSHVRGALSKEFFHGEQSELQKKRRQMKRILDQQVEERKRVKERQKQEQERKQRKQEEQIRRYYEDVKQRQRRLSDNGSNFNASKVQQTEGNYSTQNQSLVKKHYHQSLKQRANSKATLNQIEGGNIPLMQVMTMSEGGINHNRINSGLDHMNQDQSQPFYNHFERQNAGNIPLLDLSDEPYALKSKKKSKTQFKKQNTSRQNNLMNQIESAGAGSNVKLQDSKAPYHHQSFSNNMIMSQHNNSVESTKKRQRRKTYSDEETQPLAQQNMFNSRVSKGSKFQQNNTINRSPSNTKRNTEMQIPQEIEQMENENKLLKSELKKSQEAISLLIGAVRSNPKLDKFRVQAERILHNAENNTKILPSQEIKMVQKKQESPLLLPKLKIKHQSIMHDYLLEAAKKARLKHVKSQAGKY